MTNLVTLSEYKLQQGISSSKEDERTDSLITSVSQLVKTYCGNSFIDYYTNPYIEEFTLSYNTYALQLTESPIVNVSCVEIRDNYSSKYVMLDEMKQDYYVDHLTDSVMRTHTGSGFKYWPTGAGSVKVTYRAGFEACPEDLKLAVYDIITYYLKDEHKVRRSLSGATTENQGSSSQWANPGFPDHIKRILDLYKQVL
jgi:hypothetical protein